MSRSKATAGQFNLTLQICRELEIPICTLNEQDEIVEEIESRLSICDQIEKTIKQNLALEQSLRQSILKKAFEGKLVSQDPNDEPAELLLEKIKLEKEKLAKLTNSSQTKTKREKVTA
jgi:type I restriction enzyme S subunit